MSRPITLVSGQRADLSFETFCAKAEAFGYDGVEIAAWGDHLDVRLAARDEGYVAGKKAVLERAGLKAWAIAAHLIGQCVGDPWDPRLDGFAPSIFKGKSEAIVRELNSAGHEGPLSVEWEDSGMDRERGAAEALEYARRIDFASAGMAFDGAMKR